jgi:ABC-type transport system substrate-binding protein
MDAAWRFSVVQLPERTAAVHPLQSFDAKLNDVDHQQSLGRAGWNVRALLDVSDLATDWSCDEDGTELTFRLRQGVH